MQAERLGAGVVSVACVIRHAGGEIGRRCGGRVYGIRPLKSPICITYCSANSYVYYYPVFMSRVDMIIATILPFV